MSAALDRVHATLLRRDTSPLPLAVFRIAFGVTLIVETAEVWCLRQLLFDPIPFRESASIPFGSLLAVCLAAEVFLVIGFATKAAAGITYVLLVFILGFVAKGHGFDWHVDGLFLTGLLILLVSPCNRALAVDALRRWRGSSAKPVARIHSLLLVLAIGLLYLDSSLWKLTSPMYLTGLGYWAPASLPFNTILHLGWIAESELVARVAGYFVLGFELCFLLLVGIRHLRLIIVAFGILFHVLILCVFPIPTFSFLMAAFYLGIVPGEIYERLCSFPNVQTERDRAPSGGSNSEAFAAIALLILWLPSTCILAFRSPFVPAFLGIDNGSSSHLGRAAAAFSGLIYPWTGWTSHGVFMDSHFLGYTTQTNLSFPSKEDGPVTPLFRENGMPAWANRNRTWVIWTFQTVKPGLPIGVVDEGLRRFALFWATRMRLDLIGEPVSIWQRRIEVSLDDWSHGLLVRNLASGWTEVGRIATDSSAGELRWRPTPAREGVH